MPTSKKRPKKQTQEMEVIVKNPLKTTTGKIVVVLLSAGFALSGLVGLIVVLVNLANK
jgi:hypothetical protein